MRPVRLGQRYETVNAPWLVWEVIEIVTREIVGTHIVLRRVDHRETTKTVSVAALNNVASYRLISAK